MYAGVTSILRPEEICVSEALARACKLYVVNLFSVGTFGGNQP